ncbi:hypothetical protein ACH47B_37845 [Rhodococcus sp. NPDC019627]|uniref:hypothetical protein n=1 Tax=unclassified Rhodococcus (in: high G+C Gram-positive bacteria) TaxID=192944 RepID=UPI0033F1A2A9
MSDEIMTEFRAERLPDIDSPAQLATASARKTRPNFTDDYDDGSQVHDNGVRALRAGDGLICYARTCNTDQEETMTVFGDFLGDLHHLADAMGVDWDEAQRRGAVHYTAELYGAD